MTRTTITICLLVASAAQIYILGASEIGRRVITLGFLMAETVRRM